MSTIIAALTETDPKWTAVDGHVPTITYPLPNGSRLLIVGEDGYDVEEEVGIPDSCIIWTVEDSEGTSPERECRHDGTLANIVSACHYALLSETLTERLA